MEKVILIAEDNPDVLEMMGVMVGIYGYQVIGAENGRVAVEKTKHYHPDLILMDLMMPEMDGLAATRLIRDVAEFQDLPIVAVTAYDKTYHDRALDAGCNEVLPKPVDFNALQPLLTKYLQ